MKKLLILFSICLSLTALASPKAVIFDFGGVLADPDEKIVKAFIMETFRFPLSEVEDVKKQRLEALGAGSTESEFWLDMAKSKNLVLPENWLEKFHALIKKSLYVNEDMYLLVSKLKETETLVGMLSNIDHRHAKIVRDHGLYQPFEPCLLSCEIGADKPHQKAYEILIEKLSLLPNDVVFIDDKIENVDAAKKAGIDAIVFKSAAQIKQELEKRGISFEKKETSH